MRPGIIHLLTPFILATLVLIGASVIAFGENRKSEERKFESICRRLPNSAQCQEKLREWCEEEYRDDDNDRESTREGRDRDDDDDDEEDEDRVRTQIRKHKKLGLDCPNPNPPASPSATPSTAPSSSPQPSASPTSCPSYNDANTFREFIFCAFGFTSQVSNRLRNTTTIVVKDINSTSGGGLWYAWERKVELLTAQREAAVHEISHAFWEDERDNEKRRLSLVKDLIKLATLDKTANSQYTSAIDFAHEYVYGKDTWKGMFCAYDQVTCVGKDPKNLTDQEIINYTASWTIIDHEIYAGFSSWTMGQINSGTHRLPSFMAQHFTEEFTGTIKEIPYYEGGAQ